MDACYKTIYWPGQFLHRHGCLRRPRVVNFECDSAERIPPGLWDAGHVFDFLGPKKFGEILDRLPNLQRHLLVLGRARLCMDRIDYEPFVLPVHLRGKPFRALESSFPHPPARLPVPVAHFSPPNSGETSRKVPRCSAFPHGPRPSRLRSSACGRAPWRHRFPRSIRRHFSCLGHDLQIRSDGALPSPAHSVFSSAIPCSPPATFWLSPSILPMTWRGIPDTFSSTNRRADSLP